MPRFFFHVHDGVSILDREGVELDDWRAAQIEAIRLAGTIVAGNASRLQLGEDWALEVTNADGLVLFRLDFSISEGPAIVRAKWKLGDPA